MDLCCRALRLERDLCGVVVRPRPGGGPDQALAFTYQGTIHELETGGAEPADGRGNINLGPQLASADGGYCNSALRHPVYDSTTAAVFFRAGNAICKLDASNQVSLVAGSTEYSPMDGAGATARFQHGRSSIAGAEARFMSIASLAADGRGGVWVADVRLRVGDQDRIRRLDTRSGAVTTLAGAEAPGKFVWEGLAYAPAAGTLWAATDTAVCRVRTEGSDGGRVELVAGSWGQGGRVDGSGAAARFSEIRAILPVSGGRLLIADDTDLRCMDAGGAVTTLLRGCFLGPPDDDDDDYFRGPPSAGTQQLTLLPNGELGAALLDCSLALISGGGFAPASTDRLLSLLTPPTTAQGAGGSGGGCSNTATVSGVVTVRVGGGAFEVHRSVLAAGSEYFARLLAPGGGFEESGAPEVALQDADPAAFAHLLSYMYGSSFGLLGAAAALVEAPPELLRPTAALAGRLLMGGAVAALTERLAAAATPASVLSDLAWADAHGMTDLAGRLRAFAVRKRKALDSNSVEEFVEQCPQQAAKLLRAFARD